MRGGRWLRRGPWAAALAATLWLAPQAGAQPPTDPFPAPVPREDRDELPPPPGTEVDEDDTEGGQLTEDEQLALLQAQFEAHLQKGQRLQRDRRYEEAIKEFTAALALQPGDSAALIGRAQSRRARAKKGRCPRRAIADLQLLATYDPKGAWLQHRGLLIEWMGECGPELASPRLALAQEVANEDPGALGRPNDIRALVAELQYARAEEAATDAGAAALRDLALRELERYRGESAKIGHKPTPSALSLQSKLYEDAGDNDRAIEVLDALIRAYKGSPEAKAAARRRELLQDEEKLREMARSQGGKPTPQAEAAYDAGVAALRVGDFVTAEAELTRAIELAPWYPQPYYQRGHVHARNGRFSQAIDDLNAVVVLDRSNHQAHLTLGMIYKKEFAGAEDAKAIEHLERALGLRPDLHKLHLLLGELHARTDRARARGHYERFLRLESLDTVEARRARQALDELDRKTREEQLPAVPPPPEESLRFLDPELQRMINEAYLHGTEKQDWDRAEKVLIAARDRYPNEPVVLNELAKVTYAQARWGEARKYWEQSLAMREDQMEVHERLGLLLRAELPDEALTHLRRAADLGSPAARYALAALLWEHTQPLEASEQLDQFLKEAGPHNLDWDGAVSLRERMDSVFLQFYLGSAALLTLLVAIPTLWIYRRLRGASLAQLLERHPKSFPEVARILSLIRHEILKHNTAFLADVAAALEVDAPDADQRMLLLSRRLFGADGEGQGVSRDGTKPSGIHGRFLGYVVQLQQVARSHGVTLNLRRKDPIFRPMLEAFAELADAADDLRNPQGLRPGRRLELSRLLGRSGHVLGRQAFERLSGLIRSLCITRVDRGLISDVYRSVVGEEQFKGQPIAPLELSGDGAHVRVFRTDLEDILANVVRNSLRSSVLYAAPRSGLGVELVSEIDEITGLCSLAIRIKDRSPEQLSNEMLRGRYVERGMGITVDLLSRYDGAIAVEPEPGWEKAVVLRFFTLEDEVTEQEAPVAHAAAESWGTA